MTVAKRRRRKPPLPEMLRPAVADAIKRNSRRPSNPGVRLDPTDNGYQFGPPHRDMDAWEAMVCDAFGTNSESTYVTFLLQLARLCEGEWTPERGMTADETKLNAALNLVNSVRPRNEMQAALVLQMVAVHFATMKLADQVVGSSWVDLHKAAMMGKLARTFSMQMDSLARAQGRVGKQTIKVRVERHEHRHVHLGEGGLEKGTQAQAPARATDRAQALEHEPCAALQSQDPTRDRVPRAGRKR
jgi:hypothetical protein